jgi:hemerythrin-like domain-containing protein
MAEMSMNKVIHGAIRRDLDRFVEALTRLRAGDADRAAELQRAWANFDRQLTDHHEGEHAIAWPALEAVGVDRQTIAEMDAEHTTMALALADGREAMAALLPGATDDARSTALRAVEHLQQVTLTHLDHEEAEIEPVFLAHEGDPAMKQMGKEFAKVGPRKGGVFFAWVLDGATPAEREALGTTIPGPVLAVLTTVFGRPYTRQVAPVWRAA